MIDHFGINCADIEAAARFYDAVLAPLGSSRLMDIEVPIGHAIGYGTTQPQFWLSAQPAGTGPSSDPNRETHIAFTAADVDAVGAFFAVAIEVGAEVLHEPRYFPEYHERYYGAFVRDPDGNNVEAVCHTG